jgi:hypothetical protein
MRISSRPTWVRAFYVHGGVLIIMSTHHCIPSRYTRFRAALGKSAVGPWTSICLLY